MKESYNKYSQSLYLGCNDNNDSMQKQQNKCNCEGLIAKDNTTDILIQRLKKEVAELMQTTQAKLLCQDKKIVQLENYIKTNLSNYLRILFDSMVQSGEIEQIIKNIIGEINSTQLEEIENIKTDLSKVTSDLEIAKNDISMNIDNIRDNQSAIAEIKENQIDFENQGDFEINSKFQNIDISTEYINNSIVYITAIKNIKKLAVLPTNGLKSGDINTNKTNVKTYADKDNNYDVYINGGMNGVYIFDGIANSTTRLDCPYYCGFDSNNNMRFYNGLTQDITSDKLISDGIINCFSGFAPLVVNHTIANYSDLESIKDSSTIAKNFIDSLPVKHPRQILAQDDNNNFYIISIMARFNNSEGFNYDEMKNYCLSKGYKNAFNCDGGGSMQTIYNKNYIFYPSQELDTNIDREVPSVVAFKLKEEE